jgi:magnesium transporter
VAGTMSRYVTNFMLEYDEDDEDAPSMLGFTFKGIAVAALYALVVLLVGSSIVNAIGAAGSAAGSASALISAEFESALLALANIGIRDAAFVVVVTFATAPLYLMYLRRRDRKGKDINGFSLNLFALFVSTVLYAVVAAIAMAPGLGA